MEIKMKRIIPLFYSMSIQKKYQEKFKFQYNKVTFDVVFLIDREPFELLFGVVGKNFSFILKMYKGFIIQNIPNEIFYKLCDLLNLKSGKETFNSYLFLKYFESKIPEQCTGVIVQPNEVARYKIKNIDESDKIYFIGWRIYKDNIRHARNFEKTRIILGEEAYKFCVQNNISSCWSDKQSDMVKYIPPNERFKGII